MSATAIVAAVGAVIKAVKLGTEVSDIKDSVDGLRNTIVSTNGSLTSILSKYIVEPVAIVSNDLTTDEITEKVLNLQTDIFSSYYMQVFDILTKMNGVNADTAIDLLSTNTTSVGKMFNEGTGLVNMANSKFSGENYDFTLNLYDKESGLPIFSSEELSVESERDLRSLKLGNDLRDQLHKRKNGVKSAGGSSYSDNSLVNKNVPGIIQKEIILEIILNNNNGHNHIISIPVLIKTNIMYVNKKDILNLLDVGNDDEKLENRLDEYRAGAISLSDLIFATDLIKEYKQKRIKNDNDLLKLVKGKKFNANSKLVTSNGVGFEKHYNMLVISSDVLVSIEKLIKGKIKKEKYKEKLLDQTASLTVTVIDSDYERISIYTKDISGVSDVTYKALNKRSGKDNDMGEIFKALINNRPPVL